MAMEGLFASISYRLEPNGRGSRFPWIVNLMHSGWLAPSHSLEASRELDQIEAELALLPPEHAVWSLSDLRRMDDRDLAVNHAAQNLRDYFIADNGRTLIAVLREAVLVGLEQNMPVKLASAEAHKQSQNAWLRLIVGLLWITLGYLFFRDWIFATANHTGRAQGPLLWPAGFFVFGEGAARLLLMRYPLMGDRLGPVVRSIGLPVLLMAAGVLYMALAWR
jgi:hypothetical protein